MIIVLVVLVSHSPPFSAAVIDDSITGAATIPTMSAFLPSSITFQESSSQHVLSGITECKYTNADMICLVPGKAQRVLPAISEIPEPASTRVCERHIGAGGSSLGVNRVSFAHR